MNPVDHPMGGSGRRRSIPSTSPWGKVTKGKFTVQKHKNKFIIMARPTKNKRKKIPVRKNLMENVDFANFESPQTN